MNELQVWAFSVNMFNSEGVTFSSVHMIIGHDFEESYDAALLDSKRESPKEDGWRGHTIVSKARMPKDWKRVIAKAVEKEG